MLSWIYFVRKWIKAEEVTPVFKYLKSYWHGLISGEVESSTKFFILLYWLLIYLTELYKVE